MKYNNQTPSVCCRFTWMARKRNKKLLKLTHIIFRFFLLIFVIWDLWRHSVIILFSFFLFPFIELILENQSSRDITLVTIRLLDEIALLSIWLVIDDGRCVGTLGELVCFVFELKRNCFVSVVEKILGDALLVIIVIEDRALELTKLYSYIVSGK